MPHPNQKAPCIRHDLQYASSYELASKPCTCQRTTSPDDMPTLPQKLEAIRAVCVKNDEMCMSCMCNCGEFEIIGRDLLLSDVLGAMDQKLDKWASRSWNSVIASWNLLRPSLEDQDEPTVNLIYEILK